MSDTNFGSTAVAAAAGEAAAIAYQHQTQEYVPSSGQTISAPNDAKDRTLQYSFRKTESNTWTRVI